MAEATDQLVSQSLREMAGELCKLRLTRVAAETKFEEAKKAEADLVEKMFQSMLDDGFTSFKLQLDDYGPVQFVKSSMIYAKQEGSPAAIKEVLTDPDFENILQDLKVEGKLYDVKLDTNKLSMVVRRMLKARLALPEGITFTARNKVAVKGLKGVPEDGDE